MENTFRVELLTDHSFGRSTLHHGLNSSKGERVSEKWEVRTDDDWSLNVWQSIKVNFKGALGLCK